MVPCRVDRVGVCQGLLVGWKIRLLIVVIGPVRRGDEGAIYVPYWLINMPIENTPPPFGCKGFKQQVYALAFYPEWLTIATSARTHTTTITTYIDFFPITELSIMSNFSK